MTAATVGRAQFINDRDDVQWLCEVHLAHLKDLPNFRSFVIEGNEDAPDRVMLFADVCPTVFDSPVRVLVQNRDGVLI